MSVLLPTTKRTDAYGELAAQLEDRNELLIIHDVDDDPIIERQNIPEGVRFIAAGEPTHCSGKANAIATGMDATRHDRLIWTDDEFYHPPDWLMEYLSVTTVSQTRIVPIGGTICEAIEHLVRWIQILR